MRPSAVTSRTVWCRAWPVCPVTWRSSSSASAAASPSASRRPVSRRGPPGPRSWSQNRTGYCSWRIAVTLASERALRRSASALGVVAGAGQGVAEQHDVAGVPGDDEAAQPAGPAGDDAGLPAPGRQRPQRALGGVVGVGHVRVRAGGGEQQGAVGGEGPQLLALGRAGEAAGGARARRVDLPQRGDEAVGLGVQRLQRRDEPGAVDRQQQARRARQGLEGVEVGEGAGRLVGRRGGVLAHPAIQAQAPDTGPGAAAGRVALSVCPGGPSCCPS